MNKIIEIIFFIIVIIHVTNAQNKTTNVYSRCIGLPHDTCEEFPLYINTCSPYCDPCYSECNQYHYIFDNETNSFSLYTDLKCTKRYSATTLPCQECNVEIYIDLYISCPESDGSGVGFISWIYVVYGIFFVLIVIGFFIVVFILYFVTKDKRKKYEESLKLQGQFTENSSLNNQNYA